MAYHVEPQTGDIIIDGFPSGIGDSPQSGLTDMRSVNPVSVAGEASVSFSTKSVTQPPSFAGVATASALAGAGFVTVAGAGASAIEKYQAFYASTSSISGLTGATATVYYVTTTPTTDGFGNYTFGVGLSYGTFASFTMATSGTAAIATYNPATANYFQRSKSDNFMLDSLGQVWSDRVTTGSSASWTYTGNQGNSGNSADPAANGNGLLAFETVHDGTGGATTPTLIDEWLFVWRNSQIDYTALSSGESSSPIVWVSGWNYKLTSGTTASVTYNNYLNTKSTIANPHPAIVTPDSRANFCDGNYIGNWYQKVPAPGANYVGFNPLDGSTYTPQTITAVLPAYEVGQCLNFVNQYLLVGTLSNFIYPWDLNPADNTYSVPLILLPEAGCSAIVTVGNNGYIFAGNRGNIYITNGSQANFWRKVPDHISGTVEPLFTWGAGSASNPIGVSPHCAAYSKNRLYFGVSANLQAGGSATGYGGLWCADLNSGAIFSAQQMSYGTYGGYVSAVGKTALEGSYGPTIGYGLVAGWSDGGVPRFGVDVDVATPYTGGQSWVTSDMIPVGTFLKKMTPSQFEFRLSKPLAAGESVKLQAGSWLDMTYASFVDVGTATSGTFVNSDGTAASFGSLSGNFPTSVQEQQWLLVRAILTSTGTNPSYCRLTQMRVIGDTIRSQVPGQPYATQ